MKSLEERIGYQFQDQSLWENALTHSSYANEHRGEGMPSNERLEFLGDSILGLIVADHLYRSRPDLPEGDLTRIRAALVCEGSLVEVAKADFKQTKKRTPITDLKLYVKPEEHTAYYVINEKFNGSVAF